MSIPIAISVHGEEKWNNAGKPLNMGKRFQVNNIEQLFSILKLYVPVYAYYRNKRNSDDAHYIVVTGVDLKKGIVYTNNPWGVNGEQTFEVFMKHVAYKSQFVCLWDRLFGGWMTLQFVAVINN